MTALPFRANKRFILDGHVVSPGDVVDVSMLDVQKVRNMESGNFGMRVTAEAAADVAHVTPKPKARPKSKPARRRNAPPVATPEPEQDEPGTVELEQEVSL